MNTWSRRSLLVLTGALVIVEIVVAGVSWKCSGNVTSTLLTLLLVIVTTIYVGLTYGLWDEARRMRLVQFHPSLAIGFFKSVDPLEIDVVRERDFAREGLVTVLQKVATPDSETEFRFENLRLKNVGQGQIAKLEITVKVKIGNRVDLKPHVIHLDPHLQHDQEQLVTLLRFPGLPSYEIEVSGTSYTDYFGTYKHVHGETSRLQTPPYQVPAACWKLLFHDDFTEAPNGKGWRLDAWSPTFGRSASQLIRIDHGQLVQKGEAKEYASHLNEHGVSFVDLNDRLAIGRSYVVQCEARSDPNTNAQLWLWCHDLPPDLVTSAKSRHTGAVVPEIEWSTVSMTYTATQTRNLRIHIRYIPGSGTIFVRDVKVFEVQE